MIAVKFKDFDVHRYDSKLSKKPTSLNDSKEESWKVEGGHDGPDLLTQPSIVLDMFELIIVWFLPSVLSPERQVRIC
jgi:hypothetical protein